MTIQKTSAIFASAVAIIFTFSALASAQSLNGDWDVASGKMFGQDVPTSALAAMALNVSDNQFTAVSGNLDSRGTVIANPQAAIKTLEFKIDSGSDTGRVLKAIYMMENGELKITFSQTDQFPQTFESTPENQLLALTYKAGQPRTANGPANQGNTGNNIAGNRGPGGRGAGRPGRPGGGPPGRTPPPTAPAQTNNEGAASSFN